VVRAAALEPVRVVEAVVAGVREVAPAQVAEGPVAAVPGVQAARADQVEPSLPLRNIKRCQNRGLAGATGFAPAKALFSESMSR
jgi:hypothetical protein